MPASSVYSLISKKEDAHGDAIYCCQWAHISGSNDEKHSPRKEFVVTGGLDCLVKVWHMESNQLNLTHIMEGHEMAVISIAVSPDGQTIASTSLDSTLIIWDLSTGCKVHQISTDATDAWSVTFSPDGLNVASSGHSGKVVVYSVEKGTVERVFDTRGKFVLSVAWSSDGRFIATGAVDGTVCIFDVVQGKLTHTVRAHRANVRAVAFSPDSSLIVSASDDAAVKSFDVASASQQASLELSSWAVGTHVSVDGTRAAAAAADGTVTVALLKDLRPLNTFQEHTDMVCSVQFNKSGDRLLSVSKDRSINIYECPIPLKTKS